MRSFHDNVTAEVHPSKGYTSRDSNQLFDAVLYASVSRLVESHSTKQRR